MGNQSQVKYLEKPVFTGLFAHFVIANYGIEVILIKLNHLPVDSTCKLEGPC